MVISLVKTGHIVLETEAMEESMLKDIYKSVGVAHSELYYIHATKTELFYISLSTANQEGFKDIKTRNQISLSLSKLKGAFKNTHT